MADRKLTFGKYKGEPIKKIILEHIGYIVWCLSNLDWFKLNDEEQAVYDALAVANQKSGVEFVFPKDEMMSHVKNTDIETPFIVFNDGVISYDIEKNQDNPIIKSILAYKVLNARRYNTQKGLCAADFAGVLHSAVKMGFGHDDYGMDDDGCDDFLSQEEFMGW